MKFSLAAALITTFVVLGPAAMLGGCSGRSGDELICRADGNCQPHLRCIDGACKLRCGDDGGFCPGAGPDGGRAPCIVDEPFTGEGHCEG